MTHKFQIDDNHTDYSKLLEFWRANPVQAALDILQFQDSDIVFDLNKPQRAALEAMWFNTSHENILSRGTGKTYVAAVCAVLYAILYPGQKIGIISASYRQAKFVWAEIEKLYDLCPMFRDACADRPKSGNDKCELVFKNAPGRTGSVIQALPIGTDGGKIRGARFYCVLVDEKAQVDIDTLETTVGGFLATKKDPMANVHLIAKMKAALARGEQFDYTPALGNKLIGFSTAFYQYNHLWKTVSGIVDRVLHQKQMLTRRGEPSDHLVVKGKGFGRDMQMPARFFQDKLTRTSMLLAPYYDVQEGFLDLDHINKQRVIMSDYKFRMEYCAYFPPDSEGFYLRSTLDATRKHRQFSYVFHPRQGCEYAMGIDPARSGDNFAIAIYEVDKLANVIRLVRIVTYNNKPFPFTHAEIRKFIKTYNISWIKMDSGGGGTTIRDLLANPDNCPLGDKVILEKDNPQHAPMHGSRILAPLVNFSSYEWVKDTNENLLSALQHHRMQIASPTLCPGELDTGDLWEDAHEEMEQAMLEMSSIVLGTSGARLSWDTPTAKQRKDRYSAILLGYDAANELLGNGNRPVKLATGKWGRS